MSGMTRDRAIEILRDNASDASLWELAEAVDMAIEALKRPHGEWIETSNIWETEDLSGWGYWKECSSCHCQEKRRTSFCPNCGAYMKEGD